MLELWNAVPQVTGHAQVVEALEGGGTNEGATAREAEDVVELPHAEIRIDLVGDSPDQLEREEDDGKGDAVWQLDCDNVTAPDADAAQEGGTPLNPLLERGVGDALLRIDEHLTLGMKLCPSRKNIEECLVAPLSLLAPALGKVWFYHGGEGHSGALLNELRATGRHQPESPCR